MDWGELIAKIDGVEIFRLLRNVLIALGVFILGWMLAGRVDRLIRKRLGNNKGLDVNATIRPLLATSARYAIVFATLYAALQLAGIPASALLAAFGAAGLAIALAVKGTLANIAAGLMLIFLRAMRVGEYIETPSFEGTVLEVGLFTTNLKTSDGVLLTVPNAEIWANQIKNYSRYKARRIDIDLPVDRDNDLERLVKTLEKILRAHPLVINTSKAAVTILGFTNTTATICARCWLKADNLRDDASEVRLALHKGLQQAGAKLPKVATHIPVHK